MSDPAPSTTEPELLHPVDLTTPNGRFLAPGAAGWSRRGLHDTSMRGSWGRTKRWDYWAVLAGDLVVSTVYADVDYIGLVGVWWADLATGAEGGHQAVVPLGVGVDLPDTPGAAPLTYGSRRLRVRIEDTTNGSTTLACEWIERSGEKGSLQATVLLPEDHESLNVVIPWSRRRFQYTSKHQARPAVGRLTVGGREHDLAAVPGGSWGVLDVGRGRWPYRTRWNWGAGAGADSTGVHVVGIQLGGKWTEGTGHTENGVIVDGRLTKIGAELDWDYDWDHPLRPWRVVDPSGHLDLVLSPRHDRHDRMDLGVLRTEVHQVFGTWSGTVTDADGRTLAVDGVQGFAEESRSRW